MLFKIITPTSQKELAIVWIELETADGTFVIQKGHIATTFLLSKNKELLYCFKTGKRESINLQDGGILKVTRKDVTLLTPTL